MQMIFRYSVNVNNSAKSLTISNADTPEDVRELAEQFPSMIYFTAELDTSGEKPHRCYADPYKDHIPDAECERADKQMEEWLDNTTPGNTWIGER